MMTKRFALTVLSVIVFGALPVQAQFPPPGDDSTSSLGSFKVYIAPNFVNLFYNASFPANKCPLFDQTTNILSSPSQLFDPGTVIWRSGAFADDSTADLDGVPVGSAGTLVNDNMLIPPPAFPCGGLSNCSSGPGTREVHTEVRSLRMTGGGAAVRGGVWYNNPNQTSSPPARVSPGEVQSQSGPSNNPQLDFPASSFFDVFVQVDIPACGSFPGAFPGGTLYNLMPLVVKNNQVTQFPPKVVYLHDSSSIVPILFLYDNPPFWHKDDILGYFVLVGHGVGFGAGDLNQFNTFMQGQSNATCPIPPPPTASTATKTTALKSSPGTSSPTRTAKADSGARRK